MEALQGNFQYIKQLSKQYSSIQAACTEIINLRAILNLPKGTEHFLSDIHGEYEAFTHVLNNGSGVIRRKIDDIFKNTIREHEKNRLAMLIYYPEQMIEKIKLEEKYNLEEWYEITLHRLILVCRSVSSKYTRSKVRKALPKDFEYIIEELLHEQERGINKQEYYDGIIATIIEVKRGDHFIVAICKLIQRLAVDRLHILGDIYDRGPGAHKILDQLLKHHSLDIQWGNHDILWMGAAAGSMACIANTIRISAKYGNLSTIEEGYGINLLPLATFAMETYKDEPCQAFSIKMGRGHEFSDKEKRLIEKIHKAITIIQFKLEGQLILRNSNFDMDSRLLLDKINLVEGTILVEGNTVKLKDTHFPTIDEKNPYQLTADELAVMNKLKISYESNEKLQKHTRFLLAKGSMYLTYNSNLLFHGCIPMEEDGTFSELKIENDFYKGKALIDKIDRIIRESYFNPRTDTNLDYYWYLWAGPNSPLYGKRKMATFERYFLDDEKQWKEEMNPYYQFRDNINKCEYILKEFGLDAPTSHIINGHVPVKVKKGESPIKAGGKLLVIDGGLSKAYQNITGIAGYTLIFNSYGLLMVAHESFESSEEAINQEIDIVSSYATLEKSNNRIRVRDTDIGKELKSEIDGLNMLLQAYRKGLIKEK